jgi:hypothetical protein
LHILLVYIRVELFPVLPVTANLGPQLRLAPSIISAAQKGRIDQPALGGLLSHSRIERRKMGPEDLRFVLRETPPHALEKRHRVTLSRASREEDPVRRRLADAVRDDLERLANVDDQRPGLGRHVDPLAGLVERLQSRDLWRGGLEEECPPTG